VSSNRNFKIQKYFLLNPKYLFIDNTKYHDIHKSYVKHISKTNYQELLGAKGVDGGVYCVCPLRGCACG